MILDERSEFCDATAVDTGGAGSYLVGDVYDREEIGLDVGQGIAPWLIIQIDTAVTSATASPNGAKLQFHLCSDAQAAIATDGSATYHFSSAVLEKAVLVAGKLVCAVQLPLGVYERYIGILQTTSVEAATGGKINAFLTMTPAKWYPAPDAL